MLPSGLDVLFEGRNFIRLLEGLWTSASIALSSMALSIVLGTVLGIVFTTPRRWLQVLLRIYLEFIRIMPQLVLLFLVFFDLTQVVGINVDGITAAVIVFTLWGTAEMMDLVRGAITSVPQHQYESARALGMAPLDIQRTVVLPQALRRLLPATVNLTTRMIKTTSIVVLIGVVEVLKVGQQIIDANRFDHPTAAFWIYLTVFFLYLAVCFPVSWVSRKLELRWQTS